MKLRCRVLFWLTAEDAPELISSSFQNDEFFVAEDTATGSCRNVFSGSTLSFLHGFRPRVFEYGGHGTVRAEDSNDRELPWSFANSQASWLGVWRPSAKCWCTFGKPLLLIGKSTVNVHFQEQHEITRGRFNLYSFYDYVYIYIYICTYIYIYIFIHVLIRVDHC